MRTLLTALVLLLAAAGAWWLLGDRDEPVAPLPAAGSDAATSRSPGPRESAPSTEALSTRNAIESPPAPAGYVFRIKVVRDEDGAPVEGASLHVGPSEATTNAWPPGRQLRRDEIYEDYVHREGREWRSDRDGLAVIEHDEPGAAVFVRRDELYATSYLRLERDARSSEFVLRLLLDRTLHFQMVDEANAPVAGAKLLSNTGDAPTPSVLGPSDAVGRIAVRHAQYLSMRPGCAVALEVTASVLGPAGEVVRVALDPWPVEPIVVRVPSCTAIEVVVVDAAGNPWPFAPGQHATVTAAAYDPARREEAAFDGDGIARFPNLRCGARVAFSSDEFPGAWHTTTAPERAGETNRVALVLPSDMPVLTGRLHAVDGSPRGGEHVLHLRFGRSGGSRNMTARPDGRFHLAVPPSRLGSTPDVHVFGDTAEAPPRRLLARVVPRGPLQGGLNDLGEIALTPAPELARGRIEWSDGSAVDGIPLHIEREIEPGVWDSDQTVRLQTLGDGRFVAWGLHSPDRCRITVTWNVDSLPTAPVAFAPGDRDVVVRIERGASLTATFLVDADTPWRGMEYSLVAVPSGGRGGMQSIRSPDPEGRMIARWRNLSAGTYRLVVTTPDEPRAIVTIEDLAVVAGRTCDEPRLREIDLRGLLQRCELLIVGPDDRPLTEPLPQLSRADGRGSSRSCMPAGPGRFEIAMTAPLDIVVRAQGYRLRVHRAVTGKATIRMERAPEHRLRSAAAPPPGTSFLAILRLIDPTTGRIDTAMPDQHRAGVRIEQPVSWWPGVDGVYALELELRRDTASALVSVFAPARIDVRTLIPGQIIDIVPDPAALAAALAKLKE